MSIDRYKFSPLLQLHCYSQVDSIFTFVSDYSVKPIFSECFRSIEMTKFFVKDLAPQLHRSILPATGRDVRLGYYISPDVPTSPKKTQSDLNYHFAEKHSTPKPVVTFKCKLRNQVFPGFSALCQHKNTQRGCPNRTVNVDPDDIINEVDDMYLKEELPSCQQFLVDSECEREETESVDLRS